MRQQTGGSVIGYLGGLIEEINAASMEKSASAQKKADSDAGGDGSASKDPGGYQGKSTHPSAKADGNTHPAPVGARAQEHVSDVKEDVPNNVQTAPDNKADSDNNHVQLGTKKAPTGEDPASEDAYDGKKEDPGTSHPANAEEIGEKYSRMRFPDLYKVACDRLNGVLARIGGSEPVKAAAAPAAQQAAQAGYDLGQLAAADATDDDLYKTAQAVEVAAAFAAEGREDADWVGEFLHRQAAYHDQLTKTAMGMPGMEAQPGMEAGMPGGMPGGLPGAGTPPDAGATPDASAATPELGGPEDAAGGPEEGGGAGGVDDETVNEVVNAFLEAGVSPETIIAAVQGAAAGGGGESGDPAAGGVAEKAGKSRLSREDLETLYGFAVKAAQHVRDRKYKPVSHPAGSKEAAMRTETVGYLNYVREILGIR